MKQPAYRFCRAVAFAALLLVAALAHAQDEVRIDASNDESAEQSYKRMFESLDGNERAELGSAIVKLNMIGVSSAEEMLADPELRNPGPVRIKDRIAGLTAAEIIALADKTSTVKMYIKGQEPGMPGDLLAPLATGDPSYSLESTTWHWVTDVNGHLKEQTVEFQAGGTLRTEPASTVGASTWEQSADEVRIFINDRYSVSRGKFVDADHMQGTAGNKVGTSWTWSATRK